MIVLALDATGRPPSAAVLVDGQVRAVQVAEGGQPPSARLPGDLAEVLARAGLRVRDVEVFGVAVGPGSFTGMRVGIATVQGLALVHRRPVVPVSTFDAWAFLAQVPAPAATAVWIDAQRGEVYGALYGPGAYAGPDAPAEAAPVAAPIVGRPRAVLTAWGAELAQWDGPVVFVGDGAARYHDDIAAVLGARARVHVPQGVTAAAVGAIATRRARRGQTVTPHAIVPVYVRRPDAELARERRAAPAPEAGLGD